jgi:hypothetical protein
MRIPPRGKKLNQETLEAAAKPHLADEGQNRGQKQKRAHAKGSGHADESPSGRRDWCGRVSERQKEKRPVIGHDGRKTERFCVLEWEAGSYVGPVMSIYPQNPSNLARDYRSLRVRCRSACKRAGDTETASRDDGQVNGGTSQVEPGQ